MVIQGFHWTKHPGPATPSPSERGRKRHQGGVAEGEGQRQKQRGRCGDSDKERGHVFGKQARSAVISLPDQRWFNVPITEIHNKSKPNPRLTLW